jgi:hypothetical protein
MFVSRRRFLSSAAVLSAAFALKPATLALANNASWSNTTPNDGFGIQNYTREMFEPYVGDTFRVRVGKQMVDLKLVSLTDVKSDPGITTGQIARTDCFSMRFHATKPLGNRAAIRTLNHGELGDLDLFMIQSNKRRDFFQTAIINNLV